MTSVAMSTYRIQNEASRVLTDFPSIYIQFYTGNYQSQRRGIASGPTCMSPYEMTNKILTNVDTGLVKNFCFQGSTAVIILPRIF